MISLSISDVQLVIDLFKKEIDGFNVQLKKDLKAYLSGLTDREEKKYVRALIRKSGELITADPGQLLLLTPVFEVIIPGKTMASKTKKGFRNKLIKVMDYSGYRDHFYAKYFEKVAIKSCVYCNCLLTVTVDKVSKSKAALANPRRAKFQLDHFISKNEYPCFSISLFNLYPACANCNNIKSTKKIIFDLYKKGPAHVSPFYFKLQPGSKALYLLSRDISDIDVKFEEPAKVKGFATFNELFDIDGIYKTQNDVAEELILKAEIYTPAYKKALQTSFPTIFGNPDMINRLLIGNYTSITDIHKRPLVKYTIDIGEQVGLISKK
jgi:hypothetical protein